MRLSTCRISCAIVSHSGLASGASADGEDDEDDVGPEGAEEIFAATEARAGRAAAFAVASGALFDDATVDSV